MVAQMALDLSTMGSSASVQHNPLGDQDLAKHLSERNPKAAKNFQAKTIAIVARGAKMLGTLELNVAQRNAGIARAVPVVSLAMDLRDVGGSRVGVPEPLRGLEAAAHARGGGSVPRDERGHLAGLDPPPRQRARGPVGGTAGRRSQGDRA